MSRRSVGLMLLVLIAAGVAFAESPDGREQGGIVGPLLRTTIVVRDLEPALRLFRDVLGLNIAVDLSLEGEEVNRLLGVHDRKMRIVIFDADGSAIGRVAVLAYDGQDTVEPAPQANGVEAGAVVLVMSTKDIDLAYQRVRDAGYTIVSPPRVIFDRPDMVVQSREMMFIGPEGVAINLLHRGLPASPGN